MELCDGAKDARFRTVRLTPGTVSAGRIYFCHHFTRDLVWRDEWRHHANGADRHRACGYRGARTVGIGRECSAACSGRMRCSGVATGYSLVVGLSRFDIVTMEQLAREFADAAPRDERPEFMAALTVRTRSLQLAAGALGAGSVRGVRREADRIVVAATETFGVALEFRA